MNVIAAFLLTVVVLAGYPPCSSAAFYRYYDESGGVNVTNDVSSIPERYRANAVVVTGKELENKAKLREQQGRAEKSTAAQSPRQKIQNKLPVQNITSESVVISAVGQVEPASAPKKNNESWLSRQLPMLKLMGLIALMVTGVIYAGKLVSAFAPRSLAIIIRVAMLAALAVYIFKGFSGKVVDAFSRIKDESGTAQKVVDTRSERIQKQAE